MSEPVSILHPVPLGHRPPRARGPRIDLVRTRTPCRIGRAGASDLRVAVSFGERRPPLVRIDGTERLWERVEIAAIPQGSEPLSFATFAAFLAGAPSGLRNPAAMGLLMRLARTPLVAMREARVPGRPGPYLSRGDADDPGPCDPARVLADARPGAGARLQAWLDANLRTIDGRVYLRSEPSVSATRHVKSTGQQVWQVRLETGVFVNGDDYRIDPPWLRPDRVEDDLDEWHAMEHASAEIAWSPEARAFRDAGIAPALADAVALANRLPGHLKERLRRLDRLCPEAAATLDAEYRARLSALSFRGILGGIPPEEAGATLGFLSSALTPYGEAADHSESDDLWGLGRHVDGRLLPRIAAETGLDPLDGTALSGLAP